MFNEDLATFKAGGISHIVVIILSILSVVLAVGLHDKVKKSRFAEVTTGCVMLLLEVVYMVWQFKMQGFRPAQLPLQLCTLSLYVNVFMLITGLTQPLRYTAYWTLIGPVLAIAIPMQGYEFPHFRFIHFYLNHLLILLSTLYLLYTEKPEITLKTALLSEAGMTLLVLAVIYPVNLALNTDFMFFRNGANYFATLVVAQNVGIYFGAWAAHQALYWGHTGLKRLLERRATKAAA